jgi:hypothetical protein
MTNSIARTCVFAGSIAAFATLAPTASASFQVTHVAPFHGQPCTQYSGWETFLYAYGASNLPDDPTSTTSVPTLEQLDPNAFITAQGNIDDSVNPPSFRLTDTVPGDLQELELQVSINLNQFDWTTFMLTYVDAGSVTHSIAPSTSTFLVHLMGHDERLITWDLTGVTDTITAYEIDFHAAFTTTQLDALKLDTRYTCSPGVVFCAGDNSGTPCPCTAGAAGHGCENSFGTGGGVLSASGNANLASDTLVLTASGLPTTAALLFFQGDAATAFGQGTGFGDGIRCAGGSIVRLGTKTSSGGTASFGHGVGTDPNISVKGQVPTGGVTRYYQAWYRNAAPFCTPATFNLTNGLSIGW